MYFSVIKSFACETPRLRRLRQQHFHSTPQCDPPEGFCIIGKRAALYYYTKKTGFIQPVILLHYFRIIHSTEASIAARQASV